MHIISRDAKRRLVADDHTTTLSLLPQHPQQPPSVLFLPEVLFQVGTLMDYAELWSCSLVCSKWHSTFSPFLDWMAIGDFMWYMSRNKHRCNANSCACTDENRDRWCPQGSDFINTLIQRVTKPDAAFGFHSSRNSELFFARLDYIEPHPDSPTPSSTPTLRIDSICLLAEKSKGLERLSLNMRQKLDVQTDQQQCQWSRDLRDQTDMEVSKESSSSKKAESDSKSCFDLPFPMTLHQVESPNWPFLGDVTLQKCHLEHSFLRVLMINAPDLENIDLIYVSFSKPEPRELASPIPVQQTDIKVQPEEGAPKKETSDNKKAPAITSLSLWHVKGLQLEEVLEFASRLPKLVGFKCCLEDSAMPSPAMSSDQESLSALGGFKSLDRLSLYNSPCKDTTAIFKTAQDGFSYFTLSDSPMNEPLVQALVSAPHPDVMRTIELINIDLVDYDHAYNTILCSLTCLESFCVRGGVMVCDPTVLAQAKWVCSDLRQLIVKPKCNGGGQRYSAQESQDAFLAQVASLGHLSYFDFEAGDEKGDTYGFAPEQSLEIIGTIPVLKTSSWQQRRKINLGMKAYRRMTAEHVDQIMTWEKGWVFYGVPVAEDVAFVQCMKMKKQFEQLHRYHERI
ncbi:hypothetical protein EMPS_07327 [Entomortierella parvispora]|uniref:F-box domain-containing protein n=1 Tax=Entomortierella parvispora TaxID=205924 RepID=A0A9P3HE29_9FUNG|nr:hypothetical protein EMPS_07327 [Entomortierella parvispora]